MKTPLNRRIQVKAGLLGRPLARSLSPAVFAVFSKLTGTELSYELRECTPGALTGEVNAARAAGWTGFNATIPHKRAVLEMLDSADKAAQDTGSANTVRFGEKGLEGTNTDAYALSNALKERGLSVKGLSAAVYGAGGSASAAAWALAGAGAQRIDICARNPAAARELTGRLSGVFPAVSFGKLPFGEPPDGHTVLVNATPIGMYLPGTPPCAPRAGDICIDLAYTPGGTDLTRSARAAGAAAVDGLDLLVWQAALALDFWGGFPGGDIVKFKNDAAALLARGLEA